MNFCKVIEYNIALFPFNIDAAIEFKYIVDLVDTGHKAFNRNLIKENVEKYYLTFFYQYNFNLSDDSIYENFLNVSGNWIHNLDKYYNRYKKCMKLSVESFIYNHMGYSENRMRNNI